MNKFRKNGFSPEELKLYWNAEQLENLCPKQEEKSETMTSYDPSDRDAVENLYKFPVAHRNHAGRISYIHKGIEKAVFDVPETAQIILLNFAVKYFTLYFSRIQFEFYRMNDRQEVVI